MSVAADFRAKWAAVIKAADKSKGQNPDARATACYQAAEKAGQTLIESSIVASLLDDLQALAAARARIAELEGEMVRLQDVAGQRYDTIAAQAKETRLASLTSVSEEDVERAAISLCKSWPKSPNGCAAICMDRIGRIPKSGCAHAKAVHGNRARAALTAFVRK